MTKKINGPGGGIKFGNVRGGVRMKAGGDIVAGNKTTTTSKVTHGFHEQANKDAFQNDLDDLRSALRELKAVVDAAPHLDQDAKDELTTKILQRVSELKSTKETVAAIPVGQGAVQPKQEGIVTKSLERTSGLLKELQSIADAAGSVGGKAIEFGKTVGSILAKTMPLILSMRQFFGIP